jgi:hypothetical protein
MWNPFRKKESRAGEAISQFVQGQAIYTPREYGNLSKEGYQKNVIAFRCINIVAQAVSSANWFLKKGDQEIENHEVLNLLKKPNPQDGFTDFMTKYVAFLMISGNSYVEAARLTDARPPVELYSLRPDPNRQFSYADPDEPFLQGALKFSSEGGKVDWSLSYFNGYDKTPDIRRLAAGPPQQLELLFQRIQVVGGDFATVVGNYGWRGELAYTQTEDDAGDDPLTKNPFLFGVFGFDRNINEDVNWNLQLLVKQVFLHQAVSEATAFLQEPAKEEAIVSQQQEALQAGLSTRLNLQWLNDTLELELAGVLGFDLQSTVFKPKLSYAINDQLRGIVGGDLYTGPNESFFGRLGGISTAFAELRWTI